MTQRYMLTYQTSTGDMYVEIFNTEYDMQQFVKQGHVRPLVYRIEETRRIDWDTSMEKMK